MLGVVLIQLYVDAVDGIFGYFLNGYTGIWIQHTTQQIQASTVSYKCAKRKNDTFREFHLIRISYSKFSTTHGITNNKKFSFQRIESQTMDTYDTAAVLTLVPPVDTPLPDNDMGGNPDDTLDLLVSPGVAQSGSPYGGMLMIDRSSIFAACCCCTKYDAVKLPRLHCSKFMLDTTAPSA